MTRNILPKSEEAMMRIKARCGLEPTSIVQIASSTTTTANTDRTSPVVVMASNTTTNSAMMTKMMMTNRVPISRQIVAKPSFSTTNRSGIKQPTSRAMSSEEDEEMKSKVGGSGESNITSNIGGQQDSTTSTIQHQTSPPVDSNYSLTGQQPPPFSRTRLTQWHSNEEIYSILTQCSQLLSPSSSPTASRTLLNEWLSGEECIMMRRPSNGSVFLFDRRRVKNFKKDGFSWKRRKTGGANSVREDRMYLKINGVDKIYGCYSHSAIISTFHRRCYWLLDKPDLVLVHYLHTPNSETGECVVNLTGAGVTSNATDQDQTQSQLNKDDLLLEIKAMLWPYYLNEQFIQENAKLCPDVKNNNNTRLSPDEFLVGILGNLLASNPVRIVLNSLTSTSSLSSSSSAMTYDAQSNRNILDESNQSQSAVIVDTKMKNRLQSDNSDNNNNAIESCAERINLSPCFNPNPSERQQQSTSSDKQVFLSTNSCSANGGEKLMLIGNWADNKSSNQEMNSSTKPDNNKNTVKYTINLNGVEIKINQLNKHVLECNLPRFEWMFGNKQQQQAATNSVQIQANSNEEFIYKTYVYLYENGSLYCPPIAFEIKYNLAYPNRSLNLKADTTNKSMDQTSSVNLDGETSYKNQLFLLERSLILGKIYGLSHFEYGSYNNSNSSEENYSTSTASSLRRNVSFEKRICQMIDGLREHLKSRTRKNLVTADSSLSRMEINLSNEHEGKTILHICAESSLNELFDCLRRLKSTLDGFSQNDSPELGLIRNELKLFNLDHHGYTPLMLACKNGSTKIALEFFEWHKSEFEMDKNRSSSFAPPTSTVAASTGFNYQPALFASSLWYFDMINSIGEANKHSHRELASKLDTLLRECQTEYESTRNNRAATSNTQQDEDLCCSTSSAGPSSTSSSNTSSNSPSKTYLESIDAIKKQIISSCEAQPHLQTQQPQINRIVTDDLNIPSPSMSSLMIDENFRLIENLDDLSCLLADESVELNENQPSKPPLEHAKQSVHEENIDLVLGDDDNMMQHDTSIQSPLTQRQPLQQQQPQQSGLFAIPKPSPPTSSGGVGGVAAATKQIDDDQDKKIKTLADNIIAAMPHKIKTNSYSTTRADSVGSTSATNLNNNNNTVGESSAGSPFRPMNLMRRETTSFDDNYDPGISLSSCYSSSTRSSISPSSSLSYQFTGPFGPNSRFIDDQQPNSRQFSPSHNNTNSSSNNNDESTCSSTFHIDSPPSTAEFSQYFHAGSSSSAYFRNAIETGFAELTLTDDEQRELYEAALVIQNAYRRYIQRKKKKIRLDESLLPPSDADSSDAITAKDDTVNVNTSPETAALILETSSKLENTPNFNPFSKIMSAINLRFSIQQQQQQQQKTAMIVENTTTNSLINLTEMSVSVSAQQTSPPQTVAAAVMQQQAQELTQQPQQQIPVKLETITTSMNSSDGNNTANRADISVASVAIAATAATKSSSRHDDSNLSDDDESNSVNEEEQRQYQAACIIQKYYRRYKQYENLQKYNDAALKIQTRYRAYKSSSVGSKAYQQYKSGAKAKLRSHYQHNSIDETSIMGGETQPYCNGCCGGCCAAAVAAAESNNNTPVNSANGEECECVNCRRLIGSDMQLNCHHHHYHYAQHPLYQTTTHHHYTHYHNCSHHRHYHCDANSSNSHQYTTSPMINQKMISWKIMPNVRHSPRYSPASSTSFIGAPQPSPNSPGAFQNPLSVASESGVLPTRRKISEIESAVLNNNMMNDVITNFDFDSTSAANNQNLQSNQSSPFLVNSNGMMSEGSSDKMSAFHQLANNALFSTSVDNNNNNKIGEQHHNYSLNQSNFWTYLTKANVNLKSSSGSFIKPTHRVHKKCQYLNSTNQPTNFSSSNLMENNSLSSPFMIYNSNMDNHMDFNITEESSCLQTTTTTKGNNQFMFNLADNNNNNNNNTNNSTNNSLTIASFSSPKSSTSNINENNQATNNNNMNLIREDDNEMI